MVEEVRTFPGGASYLGIGIKEEPATFAKTGRMPKSQMSRQNHILIQTIMGTQPQSQDSVTSVKLLLGHDDGDLQHVEIFLYIDENTGFVTAHGDLYDDDFARPLYELYGTGERCYQSEYDWLISVRQEEEDGFKATIRIDYDYNGICDFSIGILEYKDQPVCEIWN